jgi:hypothetical protein
VRVPLLEHAGCSLLWHPKSRSRTLNGGSVVKVVHQLAEGLGIEVLPDDGPLVYGLILVKLIAQVEEEGLTLVASQFFLSCSSINLHSSSSVLFTCLSNAELIIT